MRDPLHLFCQPEMIQSMTGYGEASLGGLHCEIKTLNHRFLSIVLSTPPSFSIYEFQIRELLNTYIKRGAVYLKLSMEDAEFEPDIAKAKAYYSFIKKLQKALNLKVDVPIEPFLEFKKEKIPGWRNVKLVTTTAIRKLIESRIEEGKKIQSDIELHLKEIKELIVSIKKKAPDQKKMEKEFRSKLESFSKNELDERKVREELTLLLLRENFNEEVVRLIAHFRRFKEIVKSKSPFGKHLAFLLQEMQREANTISAKAKNAEISQLTVELKKELEILREQVENVR